MTRKPRVKKGMGKLTGKVKTAYSLGQLGWALLASLVASQLTTIWTPGKDIVAGQDWQGFIPVIVFSVVFAISKVFDAISDPIVGRYSDKFRSKWGRRIPFMGVIAIPFAIVSIFVFMGLKLSGPNMNLSTGWIAGNTAMLIFMLVLFYVCLTIYTIPYTSLISDLSKTSEDRVSLSMSIAITYFLGSLLSYAAPTVWTAIYADGEGLPIRWAIIVTMAIFAGISVIFLLAPAIFIRERDFVDLDKLPKKTYTKPLDDIKKVLSDKKFRWFILADLMYWIGLITFQAQVNSIVKDLLGIDIQYGIIFVGVMSLVSFVLYAPVSIIMNKLGVRKMMMQVSFFIFSILFTYGAFLVLNRSQLGTSAAWIQGLIFVAIAGIPMAVLGIIENVVVSDVIEYNKRAHGYDTTASFYAVRNLTMKLGQAIGMGLGAALLALGNTSSNPIGIRAMLGLAAATSLLGAIFITFYEESRYRNVRARHKAISVMKKIDEIQDILDHMSEKGPKVDELHDVQDRIAVLRNKNTGWAKFRLGRLIKEEARLKASIAKGASAYIAKQTQKIATLNDKFSKYDKEATTKAKALYTKRLAAIKTRLASASKTDRTKPQVAKANEAKLAEVNKAYKLISAPNEKQARKYEKVSYALKQKITKANTDKKVSYLESEIDVYTKLLSQEA